MNHHPVNFIYDNTQECWRAKPGREPASKKDTFEWENPTDSDMYLFFPDKKLFGEHQYKVDKRGRSERLTVNQGVELKEYPYAVFIYDKKVYAQGDSTPIIIIDA